MPERHFHHKLSAFIAPTPPELSFLRSLLGAKHRELPPGALLIEQGAAAQSSYILLEGWAIRFKMLSDGRRQILGVLLPGDLVGSEVYLLDRSTASVATITPCLMTEFPGTLLIQMIVKQPRLATSLLWMNAREEAFLGERLLSVGRHAAYERVGHFFAELYHRLRLVGLAQDDSFECPLTLELIADSLGMSHVHVSRTLGVLRDEGLLTRQRRVVRLLDLPRLERITEFAGLYLGRKLGDGELYLQPKFDE